jgi:2-isopropylmalate synthase
VIQIALDEGATTINVPDTVGYSMPGDYAAMLGRVCELVPDLRAATLSVHCHNDLGLAIANSLAGLEAGARQVECAVNGIGERAGNAALEEIVMIRHTRRDDLDGLWCGAQPREISRTSRLVSRLTGYAIQPNKAVVGRNAFAHESAIHQDGVLKERMTLRDHASRQRRAGLPTRSSWASTRAATRCGSPSPTSGSPSMARR